MSQKNFNILIFTGGGIKGLKSLVQAEELEKLLDGNLLKHFDLIGGTSTGGIISAMLGCGYKISEIKKLYLEHGERIFQKRFLKVLRNPRYDDTYINNLLTFYFGDKMMLDLQENVIMPGYNITTRDYTFFKNYGETRNVLVRDAVRATMSAQGYFKAHQIGSNYYWDGGLQLNNPSLDALTEALGLIDESSVKINLLTISTGKDEQPLNPKQSLLKIVMNTINASMTESEQLTHKRVKYAFDTKANPKYGMYVYADSTIYYSSSDMDDASPKNIEALLRDGDLSFKANQSAILKFVEMLKQERR